MIPTYNEAENLPKLVSALFSLPLPDLRLIVVDDNSPDGTGQLAEKLAIQHAGRISVLHRAGKMGLGTAYIPGSSRPGSRREAVLQMDADFSHPVEKVPELAASSGRLRFRHRLALCARRAAWMSAGRSGAKRFRAVATFTPAPSWACPSAT